VEYLLIAILLIVGAVVVSLLSANRKELLSVISVKDHIINNLEMDLGSFKANHTRLQTDLEQLRSLFAKVTGDLEEAVNKNKTMLSQRVSADVRIGAISENLLPLLTGLPYDPKNLQHLGKPIDFIYFDYNEDPSIVFVEVKSGNAKESARQKLIRNIIKEGKIHYDLVQISPTGIKVTRKV
jgi:predicted Holliday junction resolvase-like endonuclease